MAVGELVSVANVRIDYGDIILADRSGVLAMAASRAEEVLEKAFKIEAVEEAIVKAVTEGAILREARETFKYHELQRPKE